MKLTEVVNLVRLLRAIAPAQKFDDYTAEAWQPILDDVRSEDAFAAVKELGKRLPFISPADIRTEVRRLRSERMRHADQSFRFHGDPDDVPEYMRQLHAHRAAIGDGLVVDEPALDAPARPPAEVIALARQMSISRDLVGENPTDPRAVSTRSRCTCEADDGTDLTKDPGCPCHRRKGVG